MKVIDQLVLACAFLGIASEAAPSKANQGKGFSIEAKVHKVKDVHYRRSLHAINRVRRRYLPGTEGKRAAAAPKNFRKPIVPKVKKGMKKDQAPLGAGSTVANSESDDLEYICEVDIGGQKMRLNFDTGSSDLWVYSSLQPTSQQTGHNIYDPAKSNSGAAPLQGGTWNISYGDGSSAGGKVYTDKVTVGGVSSGKQAIGLAQSVSDSFVQDNTNDGLLGLGFSKGTTPGAGNTVSVNGQSQPQNTFFTNIRSTLPAPLFTVDLKHKAAGSYDFGYIDKTKYTGDIAYFPANSSQAYWQVASQSYGIKGGKTVQKSIQTIIDTGTTLLLMPQEVLDFYYKNVKGAVNDKSSGGYTYPCGTTLPDFTIGFDQGGQKFTAVIPAKYMDFGPATVGSKTCFGSLQVMSQSDSLDAIYGDIFLKAVFTVFEAKTDSTARLGFAMKPEAKAAAGSTPTSSTPTPSPTSTTPASSTSSAPVPTGTDCPIMIEGEGAVAWFKKVFHKIKAFFTGKKDVCVAAPGSDTDGSDGGDSTWDGSDDGGDDDDNDDDDDSGFGFDVWGDDDSKKAGNSNKANSAASKKAKAAKQKTIALKKALAAARAKLREHMEE